MCFPVNFVNILFTEHLQATASENAEVCNCVRPVPIEYRFLSFPKCSADTVIYIRPVQTLDGDCLQLESEKAFSLKKYFLGHTNCMTLILVIL